MQVTYFRFRHKGAIQAPALTGLSTDPEQTINSLDVPLRSGLSVTRLGRHGRGGAFAVTERQPATRTGVMVRSVDHPPRPAAHSADR
jgi:hypothetical protein